MTDNQPFMNEREAAAAARSVIPPEPGRGILSQAQRAELLRRALARAGVKTSEFERGTGWWLSGWGDHYIAIIARWVAEIDTALARESLRAEIERIRERGRIGEQSRAQESIPPAFRRA